MHATWTQLERTIHSDATCQRSTRPMHQIATSDHVTINDSSPTSTWDSITRKQQARSTSQTRTVQSSDELTKYLKLKYKTYHCISCMHAVSVPIVVLQPFFSFELHLMTTGSWSRSWDFWKIVFNWRSCCCCCGLCNFVDVVRLEN
jgi:hypothetical protein